MLESLRAKYPADKLLVIKLDVTKVDEIESAFAKAKEAFGRIDVVLNNAGWGAIGEAEGTPDDQARAMVEVRISTMRFDILRSINWLGSIFWSRECIEGRVKVLPGE